MSGKEYLGRDGGVEKVPKAPRPSDRGIFSDPQYDSVEGSGIIQNPEHEVAIKKAMGPLYGGLAKSRCDPVEEWPSDADEHYGMPPKTREGVDIDQVYSGAYRDDDDRIVTDKPGKPNRRIAASDLSGAEDRIANDKDFAEQNKHDDDEGLITHH